MRDGNENSDRTTEFMNRRTDDTIKPKKDQANDIVLPVRDAKKDQIKDIVRHSKTILGLGPITNECLESSCGSAEHLSTSDAVLHFLWNDMSIDMKTITVDDITNVFPRAPGNNVVFVQLKAL